MLLQETMPDEANIGDLAFTITVDDSDFTNDFATTTLGSLSTPADVYDQAHELFRLYLPDSNTAMTTLASGVTETSGANVFLQGPRGSFVMVDMCTAVLALISNCLIMAAVVRTKLALGGYRRFLLSLAAADILMASTTIMTFIFQNVAERYRLVMLEKCGNNLLRSLTLLGYFSSLLSIGGLTGDNFLGIFKPLRYNQIMGGRRTQMVIVILWILSVMLSFIDMPITAVSFLTRFRNSNPSSISSLPSSWIQPTTPSAIVNIKDDLDDSGITSFENDFVTTAEPVTTTPRIITTTHQTNSLLLITPSHLGVGTLRPPHRTKTSKSRLIQPNLSATKTARIKRSDDLLAISTMNSSNNSIMTTTPEGDDATADLQLHQIIHDILQYVEVEQEPEDWCTFYSTNKFGVEFFVIGLTIPCFILLLVIYGRIFYEVMTRRDAAERNTKRLVLTTLLLIGSFTFTWMPFVTFELLMLVRARTSASDHTVESASHGPTTSSDSGVENTHMLIINCLFNSLLMLSPLINPIIYAARLTRVRAQLLAIVTCNKANLSISEEVSTVVITRPSITAPMWNNNSTNGFNGGNFRMTTQRTQSAISRYTTPYAKISTTSTESSQLSTGRFYNNNVKSMSSCASSFGARSLSMKPSLEDGTGVTTPLRNGPNNFYASLTAKNSNGVGMNNNNNNHNRETSVLEEQSSAEAAAAAAGTDQNDAMLSPDIDDENGEEEDNKQQ